MNWFIKVAAAMALVLPPAMGVAQGCSLCRDATAGSGAKAREGLRRGILMLGIPAGVVFAGIFAVAWKMKPRAEED